MLNVLWSFVYLPIGIGVRGLYPNRPYDWRMADRLGWALRHRAAKGLRRPSPMYRISYDEARLAPDC